MISVGQGRAAGSALGTGIFSPGAATAEKARKVFFFEKKKQKTFAPALGAPRASNDQPCTDASGQKFFGSFSQKRTFFLS
jgi:hypothetical protein